ncbi:CBL-interacting protein kinase [Musa troglodytarum]|uniref:CBL-interacting protein kinase n=1 Tax=Musa troglodytarum TaxID=320322 RepID=A0A9E7JEJ8_9LILI|nr:CBL-interacting protein kinase [Musa troglodytarum]URD77717.1 CBL-interacting protein kinase [Musa troglodytarum]
MPPSVSSLFYFCLIILPSWVPKTHHAGSGGCGVLPPVLHFWIIKKVLTETGERIPYIILRAPIK